MKKFASCALQSALTYAKFSLFHRQSYGYFKTPHLFVKYNLRHRFREREGHNGPRKIDIQCQKLADLLVAEAKKGKGANLAEMLAAFYQELDALSLPRFSRLHDEKDYQQWQEHKAHLKVYLLLQIQHNEKHQSYASLKTFGSYLRAKQEEIAKRVIQSIIDAEKTLSNEKQPRIRKMLLEKLNSTEFQEFPALLVDEFKRLFDFNMPFAIDSTEQNPFVAPQSCTFSTFCPTLTIAPQIFKLLSTDAKTCFVAGPKSIGKAYCVLLLYYLKRYCENKIFYIANSIKCSHNDILAKQLFQSCWATLSPGEIDTLSDIYCGTQEEDDEYNDQKQFEVILSIFKRNRPSVIFFGHCNYITGIGLYLTQQYRLKGKSRFERLIQAAQGSICIFSSWISTENKDLEKIVMDIRKHPMQYYHECKFYSNISNQNDLWTFLEFEMEDIVKARCNKGIKQAISRNFEAILQDEQIKSSIDSLLSQFKYFNFVDLATLAQWLLVNNKQTTFKQNFDLARFKLEMKNDFVKKCVQRMIDLTFPWVYEKRQKQENQKRIDFVCEAIIKEEIIQQNDAKFQKFPYFLLENMSKESGPIIKILRDYYTQFEEVILRDSSLNDTIRAMIRFFKQDHIPLIINFGKFIIQQSCQSRNLKMKYLIKKTFGIEGKINLQSVKSDDGQILKTLLQRCLKYEGNIYSYTTDNEQYLFDFIFMVRRQKGPLIVIFMEYGRNKGQQHIKKLLTNIDDEFYPELQKIVPKDVEIEIKVWMTTRNNQFFGQDYDDNPKEQPIDYGYQLRRLAAETVSNEMKGQDQKLMTTIVNKYKIEIKITDLELIYNMFCKNLYKAAVDYRKRNTARIYELNCNQIQKEQ